VEQLPDEDMFLLPNPIRYCKSHALGGERTGNSRRKRTSSPFPSFPSLRVSSSKKAPTEESASKDIFKSKKMKKLEGKYTDRAAQRRAGMEDEFSEALALKEEFER